MPLTGPQPRHVPWAFGSQAGAQSIEPHQPGLIIFANVLFKCHVSSDLIYFFNFWKQVYIQNYLISKYKYIPGNNANCKPFILRFSHSQMFAFGLFFIWPVSFPRKVHGYGMTKHVFLMISYRLDIGILNICMFPKKIQRNTLHWHLLFSVERDVLNLWKIFQIFSFVIFLFSCKGDFGWLFWIIEIKTFDHSVSACSFLVIKWFLFTKSLFSFINW